MQNNETSDISKAADHADATQIKQNLDEKKQADKPENLSDEQKTPFIEEELRTDK